MKESELAREHEYTDEILLEYFEKTGEVKEVIREMVKVCSNISKSQIKPSKESIRVLVGYLFLVVNEPDNFFSCGGQGNLMRVLVEQLRTQDIQTFSFLVDYLGSGEDARSSLEALLREITRGTGESGKMAMHQSIKTLLMVKKLSEREECLGIFKDPGTWGVPGGERGEENGCFLDCILEPYMVYSELPLYNNVYFPLSSDFLKKTQSEKDQVRREYQNLLWSLSEQLYFFVKILILKNDQIKKNFIFWVIMVAEKNKERKKTLFKRERIISDGYLYLLSLLISKFIQPICKDIKRVIDIPLDFIGRCPYINPSDFDGIQGKIEKKPTGIEEDTFVTKLIYVKLLLNQIFLGPIILQYKETLDYFEQLKSSPIPQNDQQTKNRHKLLMEQTSTGIEYHRMPITSSDIVNLELSVLLFLIHFLKRAMKQEAFSSLPITFIESSLLILKGLNTESLYPFLKDTQLYSQSNISQISIFCSDILENQKINVNYKQLSTKILHEYIYYIDIFIPSFVHAVLHYYNDIQRTLKNNMERLEERSILIFILSTQMKKNGYQEKLKDFLNESPNVSPNSQSVDTRTMFLLHLISSLIEAQERGFEELKKTSMIEKNIEESKLSENEERELSHSLSNSISFAKAYFQTLLVIEAFLSQIIKLAPKAFLVPIVSSRLASMLNASLMSLVGSRAKDIIVKDKAKCGFQPETHLLHRMRMYILLRGKTFLRSVVEDTGMFKSLLFEKAVTICKKKGLIIQAEEAQFSLFLQSIKNLTAAMSIEQTIEFPDEYMDPLTFAPMIDPVILLTSNTKVDRSTAQMILMNDSIDPFTREPLTESDIADDIQLKEEITKFLQDHK
ncbi:ubiquitin conjugation factor E4 B [Nematocida sp. LUAm3]|nr:ubiquitin conjugation factor E4 B [Nematocida sp. LUAm3]KAI5173877.1 ubiquitin conjugation factor E4 B [Nematocida sp. LUAm2]KAI5177378.1 ubiquitin conjugation factor E4 B [Nematocida sp. LUAm1]